MKQNLFTIFMNFRVVWW